MSGLNFDQVPDFFKGQAIKAFEARDVGGILFTMSNEIVPYFVYENAIPLKSAGLLEQATLSAWSGIRTNCHHLQDLYGDLFRLCDIGKLRACGDPLPGTGPFRLYRGVAGRGKARVIRGYSWTASLERAQWFAKRFSLPNPAVCRIEAPESWILAYLNQSFRNEQEFLVLVPKGTKVSRILIDEPTTL